MKVTEEKTIRFERGIESAGRLALRLPAMGHVAVPMDGRGREHDARSLIIAVAMCAVCWLVLAYYLLG